MSVMTQNVCACTITTMRVVAVMPAYNAASTVEKTCASIPIGTVDEIILVDDCSKDDTAAIARKIPGVTVLEHPENRGYGANQKTCYATALARGADIVVMVHPDFQYDPSCIPQIIEPLLQGKAEIVLGSRFLGRNPRASGMPAWRYWSNRVLTRLQNSCLGIALTDGHTGYRAYAGSALRTIPFNGFSNDFAFDAQMIATAARLGLRFAEISIPTRYLPDSSSISPWRSVRYGLATIASLMPVRNRLHRATHA